MLAAGRGCYGIFHLASPCTVDRVLDPQKERVAPAVEGTLHVPSLEPAPTGLCPLPAAQNLLLCPHFAAQTPCLCYGHSSLHGLPRISTLATGMIPPRINASMAMFLHLKGGP
ncbi:uncharacterized protein LOC125537445 [Triticum urartu]|uniref:Uncharacterized protein n=1 Tax=Triticum urartu TaxID=4572 RepID=A0A8R7THH3_TRIUA|nr:uncharacterized protein LOC125537445 [Triticum urartu]